MGTMNFSIPDDVKDKFNEVFEGENKSAIVTRALIRAIEDQERQRRSESFLEQMRENHAKASRTYTDEEIRALREELRK